MKVQIELEELRRLLIEAYENGWRGSLELKEDNAEEMLKSVTKEQPKGVPREEIPEFVIWNTLDTYSQLDESRRLSEDVGEVHVTVGGVSVENIDPADRSTWNLVADEF